MKSISLKDIDEHTKTLLEESTCEPQVVITPKLFENDETNADLLVVSLFCGVKSGEKLKTREVFKRAGDFEVFDKVIQLYFREFKFVEAFQTKKVLSISEKLSNQQRTEMIEQYFLKLLRVPGIVILPAFLEFFDIPVDLFLQEK